MPGSDAARIMRDYLDAFAERDFARARRCLSDSQFCYVSPLSTFNSADTFITDISRLGAILERMDILRIFAEGPELCAILTITVRMSEPRTIPIALWATVVDGRIVRMQAFFDGRDYDSLFEA